MLVEVASTNEELKKTEKTKSGAKEQEIDLDAQMVNLNNEMFEYLESKTQNPKDQILESSENETATGQNKDNSSIQP